MHNPIKLIYAILTIVLVGITATIGILRYQRQIETVAVQTSLDQWIGSWQMKDSYGVTYLLEISDVTDHSITYSIRSSTGDQYSGVPYIQGDKVRITSDKIQLHEEEDEPILTLKLASDTTSMELSDNACFIETGLAADSCVAKYLGTYTRVIDSALRQSAFFTQHASAYASFQKLVGDFFPDFEWTVVHETSVRDAKLGADGAVFSIDPSNEKYSSNVGSIILVGSKNEIYAALASIGGTGHFVIIDYFTNVPDMEETIPDAIKNWKWMKIADDVEYVSKIRSQTIGEDEQIMDNPCLGVPKEQCVE